MSPRLALFALLAASLATLGTIGQGPAPSSTPAALEGTWELVSMIEDGKSIPITLVKQTALRGGRITVAGGFVAFTRADGSPAFLPCNANGTVMPRTIDLTGAKSFGGKGIYLRDGDTLLVCMAGATDRTRPTQFASIAGSGTTLMTFQKIAAPPTPVPTSIPRPAPAPAVPGPESLKTALVGTWGHQTDDLIEKVTFNPDGTFSIALTYKRGFKKLFDARDRVSGRWDVRGNVVVVTVTASTIPERRGQVYSYQVNQINQYEVLYTDNQTGQRRVEWKVR